MGVTDDHLSYWQAEKDNETLIDITIGDFLDLRADEIPTQEAVVYSCYPEFGEVLHIRWTYQEYRNFVNQVARGLMALGLNKGDHIAVCATNIPAWLLLEMAAAKVGLVLVTINPALRAQEIEYVLKQGDVSAFFFLTHLRDHDFLAPLEAMIFPGSKHGKVRPQGNERLPLLKYVCLLDLSPNDLVGAEKWRPEFFYEMVARGQDIPEEALHARQAEVTPFDPFMIQYTSGTTGFPKGAVLVHRGVLNNASVTARRWGLSQRDRDCMPTPFFHSMGCITGVLGSLCAGSTLHPTVTFDPVKVLQIISTECCTTLASVPTMLTAILQSLDSGIYDLSSLDRVRCGGSPVPVSLMEQVETCLGAKVGIGFGQSEAGPTIARTLLTDSLELRATTVGLPLPYTEIKIINPSTGIVVVQGECGELCCRGAMIMQEYYKMPENTAEVIDGKGWLHTGDIATMNAHGYINIVGRLKDMVIRGGENIYPRQVEEFLLQHPQVAEVQVVGVPDHYFGEELLAVVRVKRDNQLTEKELRAFCKNEISHQKIPRYFLFVESYPLTASGKVQKFRLRENAIKVLGLEDEQPFHQNFN